MPPVRNLRLDPVKYETFLHRLWAIGEEGRASIQRVTASPIVSQGGECMASFYTAEGTMILACSGHLRFAAATSDAIKKLIEWYSRSPGFFDGDQFFFNDPYVAGAHTFDMMIIKPVFYRNNPVAWVSSSVHTADTGGVLRGLASEIYHEGIRIQGMKLVEKGEFREDVFRCLTQQCRDPEYVGLDLKSQIASNNVCAMSKEGDDLLLDFTGTSAEMTDSTNSTLAGTIAQIAVVMTDFLFWDVPWSDGRLRPVKIHVPKGSILNCTFPAACGGAPAVGVQAKIAVSDCIARMLYSAGYQDINAPWQGIWYTGGPGYFYGGHNRDGIPVAQGLYDGHGSGLGATPTRDGVHCGGNMNIPSGGISDVERIEMQYPFLYFTRNFHLDGGGSGKFNGGTGSFRIYMIYGSQDCSVSYSPYSRLPEGVGLFGGNPAGIGGVRAVYHTAGPALLQRLKTGQYPMQPDQIDSGDWGTIAHPAEIKGRVNLPEFTIVADFVGGGGGYGDPIEREPDMVAKDVRRGIVSPRIAEKIHGVVLIQSSLAPDNIATLKRRQEIREERIREGKPFSGATSSLSDAVRKSTNWEQIVKFHEYLAIARNGKTEAIRCLRCGHLFCPKHDNYKRYALRRERDLFDLAQRLVPSGESYLGGYLEYYCPGCATLLQVDGYCDAFPNSKEPLHDFYQQP
jgi:N-methylhydantoinase B/oxoprolinase/acetone carboxylase alpha subunit